MPEARRCSACGRELTVDMAFCDHCGRSTISAADRILAMLAAVRDAYVVARNGSSHTPLGDALSAVFHDAQVIESELAQDNEGRAFRDELLAQLDTYFEQESAAGQPSPVQSAEAASAPAASEANPPPTPSTLDALRSRWSGLAPRTQRWLIAAGVVAVLAILGNITEDRSSTTETISREPVRTPASVATTPDPDEPSAVVTSQVTSMGLTRGVAKIACERRGEREFPYGFDPHWIVGRIAERVEGDRWFLKVNTTVTNDFNAERDIVVECYVGGTDGAPTVEMFDAY